MLDDIRDARARGVVERVLDAFEARVTPVWPRLRAQVAHTDLTVDNTLTDDDGFVTGIIDFGDMSHTALIADLASVLDSLVRRPRRATSSSAPPGSCSTATSGACCSRRWSSSVLGVAWAARSAITIAISSWRVAQGLEEQRVRRALQRECRCGCSRRSMDAVGWDEVARALGAEGARGPTRRSRPAAQPRSGPAIDPLFYASRSRWRAPRASGSPTTSGRAATRRLQQRPVRRARPPAGRGGDRPPEPRASTRTCATCTRAAIELAERLTATCPPGSTPCCSSTRARRPTTSRGGWRRCRHRRRRRDRAPRSPTTASPRRSPRCPRRAGSTAGAGARRDLGAARHLPRAPPRRTPSPRRVGDLAARGHAPAAAILDGARHERRHRRPRPALRAASSSGATHEAGGAVDRRRGPGRPRPHRRGAVVLRALRRRPGLRHARQADGQRPPGRRGHHAARHRRRARRAHDAVQHVRRQPGQRGRRARPCST